jgi:hypothetical protein
MFHSPTRAKVKRLVQKPLLQNLSLKNRPLLLPPRPLVIAGQPVCETCLNVVHRNINRSCDAAPLSAQDLGLKTSDDVHTDGGSTPGHTWAAPLPGLREQHLDHRLNVPAVNLQTRLRDLREKQVMTSPCSYAMYVFVLVCVFVLT